MLPGAFLALVCVLSVATAQQVSESVFKQLTTQELAALELAQNPKLLEFAARTGERVQVDIKGPSQGAVAQDGVNVVLNCLPWLMNFPGASIRWYFSQYSGVDHTSLGPRTRQTRQGLMSNPTKEITGDFDEIFNITRTRIIENAQNPGRGIYECEVCVQKGTIFEACHRANTTLLLAGRPPLLNSTTGRTPDRQEGNNLFFRIGATICIEINPVTLTPSDFDIMLRCPITPESPANNIPPAIPVSTRLWTHTNLVGMTASLSLEEAGKPPTVPSEFLSAFPGINEKFIVDTRPPADTLIFSAGELRKNASDPGYQNLRQSFGSWTCTVNNSLGTETATTHFSDMCGMAGIPSIVRGNCSDAGTLIANGLAEVQRGQPSSIPIGCDVCVKEAQEIWLTIVCPTNADSIPNVTVTISWRDEKGNELQGDGDTLLVQTPGKYRCIADFGGGNVVSETTDIGFLPSADITVKLNGGTNRGCNRLRNNTFSSSTVCAFLNEDLEISCDPGLENVTGTIQPVGSNPFNTTVQITDEQTYTCSLSSSDTSNRCVQIAGGSVTVRVFDPAKITSPKAECTSANNAGQTYGFNTVNTGGQVLLCCAVSGRPKPKTTWSRIVTDPTTGLTAEMALPGGDTNINFDNSANTLTFATYNSTYDGTYICRTSNIAGVDAGTVSLSSQPDNAVWVASEWSECDPKCRNGNRTRDVSCRSSLNNRVRPNSDCDCNNILDESELCINVPDLPECFMIPLWRTGNFGKCSKGCAGGYKSRSVECAIPFDGKVVDDVRCTAIYGYKPLGHDFCFNRCCYEDVYPYYCYYHGRNRCKEPIYQQNCCWTCGRANFP